MSSGAAACVLDSKSPQQIISTPGGGQAALFSRPRPESQHNEDRVVLIPAGEHVVLGVADGVGGAPRGDEAAQTAVDTVAEVVRRADPEQGFRQVLLDGIDEANDRICELGGAATTIALVELTGPEARSYHVGDSTVLLVGQRGKIKFATLDHSPVGYGIEAGLIAEDEAIDHEDRHLVSNVLGRRDMRIDVGPILKIARRDTLVLGTDGLFDNASVDEIVEIVRKGPLERAVEHLAALCLQRMTAPAEGEPSKPDDCSFVLFRPGAGTVAAAS